jgi:hypothetical protein
MKSRPIGITIMGVLLVMVSILAFILGISIIIPGTPLDILWTLNSSFPPNFKSTLAGMIFGYFLIILSIIGLYTRWGLLKGRKWAWWIIVIIFVVNGIGDLARIVLGGVIEGIFGILIAAGFLFYLTRPGVRAFFETKSNKEIEEN